MSDGTDNQSQVVRYKEEAMNKYDAFMAWMIDHWPQRGDPLSTSDFSAGKRELDLLLGAKLHAHIEGRGELIDARKGHGDDDGQYRPVTPAPWP